MKLRSLQLQTAHLPALIDFYHAGLGLPCSRPQPGVVRFQAGGSSLAFTETPGFEGIYHFAFNIPHNQTREAHDWLQQRGIFLIAGPGGNTRIEFESWHAEALYFFDPAGNIVELIARRDLPNANTAPFGADSLLEISEIGVVTPDVPAWTAQAALNWGIGPFDKSQPGPAFAALGTDSGLFIVVQEGRKWLLTDIAAAAAPISVQFENDAGQTFTL